MWGSAFTWTLRFAYYVEHNTEVLRSAMPRQKNIGRQILAKDGEFSSNIARRGRKHRLFSLNAFLRFTDTTQ